MTYLLPCHHFSSFPPPSSSSSSSSSSCSPSSSSFNFWSRGPSTVQFLGHRNPIPAPRPHRIICMANPRRVAMVAKQIRRELSDMLITDKNLQYAVLPEAALGADRYLSSVTTISDVEVSADLQVVKVFVSIFGDERGREVALSGLKAKAKYVRGQLGRRMKLRLTPEIRFVEDESLERGSRVIAILDKLKNKNDKQDAEDEENNEESFNKLASEDDEWGEEDPDEDVIYVR